jgi:hypothetical protein
VSTIQLLIVYSAFVKYFRKYGNTVKQCIRDCKKVYVSVKREVLCNILIGCGITMKMARLINMCLNEAYSSVQVQKHLSDMLHIKKGLEIGDALSPLLSNCALEYAIRRVQVNHNGLKLNVTHQLQIYADDVNILGGSTRTYYRKTENL